MSELKPLGHRVLVQLEKAQDQTDGGIWKPQSSVDHEQRQTEKGIIKAIGDTAWVGFADSRRWAEVGDVIGFATHAGVLIEHEGEFYRAMNDEDIYVKYERG